MHSTSIFTRLLKQAGRRTLQRCISSARTTTELSSGLRFALKAAGTLSFGVLAGSLAHLALEARDDVVASNHTTRASQLQEAINCGAVSVVSLSDGRQIYVRDAAPTSRSNTNTPVALVIGMGLASSGNVVESLRSQGLRVITFEENLDSAAAGTETASSVSSRSELIAAVLNDCKISDKVVVVASALEWLPAVHFCSRNQSHVQGLLIVDPILPSLHQIEECGARVASATSSAPTPLQAASEAISKVVSAPSFALTLTTLDPLHMLEHVLTGKHHHHLFCGSDHGLAPPAQRSRVAEPSSPRSQKERPVTSEADDTVDCTALHTEVVYRSHLYGLDHIPTLVEMLPTVGQSIAPTLARTGVHLGPFLDAPADPRVAALDARVLANAHACADPAAQQEWISALQSLADTVPIRVRITLQDDSDVARLHKDATTGAAAPVTEAEVELRLRLQADANRRLDNWRSVLPRRVTSVACAAPSSGRDVFEPDAEAVAAATVALARVLA